MRCNILTYIVGILLIVFIIYVYTSKLPLDDKDVEEGFEEEL